MATIRSEDGMKATIGILSEELARKRMIRIAEGKYGFYSVSERKTKRKLTAWLLIKRLVAIRI